MKPLLWDATLTFASFLRFRTATLFMSSKPQLQSTKTKTTKKKTKNKTKKKKKKNEENLEGGAGDKNDGGRHKMRTNLPAETLRGKLKSLSVSLPFIVTINHPDGSAASGCHTDTSPLINSRAQRLLALPLNAHFLMIHL